MKFKSIVLASLFALSFFSCSMEDENVLNDMDKEISTPDKGNSAMAALTVNVFVNELSTKATTSVNDKADTTIVETTKIDHCSIILLNANNNVIDARDGIKVSEVGAIDTKFALKQQSGLKVVVVANSSKLFAGCQSMTAINEIVQEAADLESLVKMGITEKVSTENFTYDNPAVAQVELKQLAARIELASFNITKTSFSHTLPVDVTLNEISLINVNNGCKTIMAGNEDATTEKSDVTFATKNIQIYKGATKSNIAITNENKPVFYSFPRTVEEDAAYTNGDKAVTMKITFTVGDVPCTKYYKIQHTKGSPSIESGYLYRLNVNMTAESNEVEFNVTCSVKDWKYEAIEVDLEENI